MDGLKRRQTFDPETRDLLYALMRGAVPPAACPWEQVRAAASAQALLPNLYYGLSRHADLVPVDLLRNLRLVFWQAVRKSAAAYRQLGDIGRVLGQAKIDWAVLKGPAAAAYYPEPALRLFGDLDLLVPQEQLSVTSQAFLDVGYRPMAPLDPQDTSYHHLPPLVAPNRGLTVELHWAPTQPGELLPMPMDAVWGRLVELQVLGVRFKALHPVDQLLHGARHAFYHHRFLYGLRSVLDAAYLVRGWSDAEWATLRTRADSAGWQTCVGMALGLAAKIAANPEIPRDVRIPQGTRRDEFNVEWGEELLWELPGKEIAPDYVVQNLAEPWGPNKLARTLRYVFMPPPEMAETYHTPEAGPRLWLTYVWRPIDLLLRRGPTLWSALRRNREMENRFLQQVELERWLQQMG